MCHLPLAKNSTKSRGILANSFQANHHSGPDNWRTAGGLGVGSTCYMRLMDDVVIPLVKDLHFEYGVLEHVSPNVRRLIAHNPSPFTYAGTGTYVVGRGSVAVIDPGPASSE